MSYLPSLLGVITTALIFTLPAEASQQCQKFYRDKILDSVSCLVETNENDQLISVRIGSDTHYTEWYAEQLTYYNRDTIGTRYFYDTNKSCMTNLSGYSLCTDGETPKGIL